MADKGRDYKFALLSDLDRFDLDPAARDIDKLGQNAKDLGDDADKAARELDDAFDRIARSTRSTSRKVDGDTDKMRGSIRDVGTEASSTARESAASFSSTGDIGDAMQELAANAGETFGPIGIALGVAAAAGVGLFRTNTEALKERANEIADALIEAGGRLDEEFIQSELKSLAKEGDLERIKAVVEQYQIAGVTYADAARARAGDEEAIARVTAALETETARRKESNDELTKSEAAVAAISDAIGDGQSAMELAQEAFANYAAVAGESGTQIDTYVRTARGNWDDLKGAFADPVRARVLFKAPTRAQYVAARADLTRGIGTIVVPVKPGQSRFENTSNNSRYRE